MPLIVPGGTLRLIARPGFSDTAAPIVGFGITPFPEGVVSGDLLHVRLLRNGAATWRVVQQAVMSEELTADNPNAHDFNTLYVSGHVGALCWPDLREHAARVREGGELGALGDAPNTYLL